ncbi:MAG: hypothetical protein JSV31_18320 [Desulfobacterales bacterium]|nr:MAG: hypothetical protein JSV31_18320 [Desulfobacterales bacterium]
MTVLKGDLRDIQKDIKALERKMEKLVKAFGKEPKTKAKRSTRKVTARKATAKRAPVRKAAAQKKSVQATATEQVLKIVKRSRKGVDVPTLRAKTGFDDKKVRNIIFRTSKEGKIKKIGRGIYVGA